MPSGGLSGERRLSSTTAAGTPEKAKLVMSVNPDGTLASSGGSSGVGNAITTVLGDGDLQTIDAAAEAIALDPAANTAGAGTNRHSSNFLLRWLVKLLQLPIALAVGGVGIFKFGGVYNTTKPTLTDGQRTETQYSNRGFIYVDFLDIVSTPNIINTVDVVSATVAGQNSQNIITGNPTNNSTVQVEVSGSSSFAVLVTGTWVGTLQFERSLDNGTTWTSVGAFSAGTNFIGQTITSNGAFHGNASSATHIRVRAIAWTSGVASIRILAGQGTGTITVGNPIRLFDAINNAIATIKAALTPATPSDTALVITPRDFGSLIEVVQTITRPNDTTAYAASDAIANSTTQGTVVNPVFANAARSNGNGGYIVSAQCQVLGAAFNTALRLHLFRAAPTAIADNAIYTALDSTNTNYVGYIDFSSFTTAGTGSDTARSVGSMLTGNALPYVCGGASTSLFGMVEVRAGFTPTALQTFRFQLAFERT